jgi:hypothetical protein
LMMRILHAWSARAWESDALRCDDGDCVWIE